MVQWFFFKKYKLLNFFLRSDSMCYLRKIVHGKLNLGEIFSCCAACNVKALSWRGNNSGVLTLPLGNASGLLWRKQVFKYKSINFFFSSWNQLCREQVLWNYKLPYSSAAQIFTAVVWWRLWNQQHTNLSQCITHVYNMYKIYKIICLQNNKCVTNIEDPCLEHKKKLKINLNWLWHSVSNYAFKARYPATPFLFNVRLLRCTQNSRHYSRWIWLQHVYQIPYLHLNLHKESPSICVSWYKTSFKK